MSQQNYELIQQLHHSKSQICSPGHPETVYFENDLSAPLERVLNLYMANSTTPKIVINDIRRFHWTSRFASCLLMFVESHSIVNHFKNVLTHILLIVTSAAAFDDINDRFIEHGLCDTVFLVLERNQLTIYHFNKFLRMQNRWTRLDSNPLVEAGRDLAGTEFMALESNAMEALFAKFVATQMNATLVQTSVNTGIVYTQFIKAHGDLLYHIYMHRTTGLRALVPKLEQLKPIIYALVDPYDIQTWAAYGILILAIAFLRMCCSRQVGIFRYMKSIQEILACTVLSSRMHFHRLLEQINVGIFKLLSVVLVTAYESLVISFLLNPRFYPELDSIEQVNESCCWTLSGIATLLEFRNLGACRSAIKIKNYIPTALDRGRFECYLIDPSFEILVDAYMSQQKIVKYYRWAKVQLQPYPMLAVTFGGVGIHNKISFYAGVFFAEGALFRASEAYDRKEAKEHDGDKPVKVEDLSLLWIAYSVGAGLSLMVFAGELIIRRNTR